GRGGSGAWGEALRWRAGDASIADGTGGGNRLAPASFSRAPPAPMASYCAGSPMSATDEELVRQAQGGDRTAFEELVRRMSRLAFARLFLETGDAHRAEDLLQETLLSA